MNQTVIPALKNLFGEQVDKIGKHQSLDVPEFVRNVIVIDQDPSVEPHAATLPPTPNSSMKSAAYSPPPRKQKPAATKKAALASTSKAVDAKPARATASSA
jgi:hypothetical protein